jgi:NCS1 family nucleobase:cation symporter-1
VMTGFGLGWVNAAADYSRYLPRATPSRAVVGWTTFGAALAPVILVIFGLLLAGSSAKLSSAIGADPIGALTTILPVWFLVPFAIVAILGLVGGAVLDIYSSGLALLSAGIRIPRPAAAGIDGVVMIIGAIYVAFFSSSFIAPFEAFLVTLGVPVAAWAGIFIADIILRKANYAEADLYNPKGRYGNVRLLAILLIIIGTAVGWGLVTNTYGVPSWLNWQGYLLGPVGLGGVKGAWAYANLGVLVSLAIGFVGTLVFGRGAIRRQESLPVEAPAKAEN